MRTREVWACIAISAMFYACDRTTEYVQTVAPGPTTCAECHDPSNLITGKQTQWAESVHGTGTAYLRGTSKDCAGCHSGNAFAERIKAGLNPDQVAAGDPDPTRQDCRACHKIHETYTKDDFALRSTKKVTLFAVANASFDGGEGNLCVNCHQPRRDAPVAVNGIITGISSHWGPHHGPQSAMLLGVAGAGVTGKPSGHYGAVPNTCVQCHMGDDRDHHFDPVLAACQKCHPGATNFDIDGVQTDIIARADQLGELLLQAGLINENSPDGHPIVTSAPEDQGIALYNWLYVAHEDKSNGVHNVDYARALLDEGITRMGGTPPPAPAAPATLSQATTR
ncbi:MAG TPA: hypothetical protein VFH88_01150 [Candidatus Krumholzibacteria bacterium]|nr:hypothetical protein [Candidatus Krumholzibacteria bacterium]